MSILYENEVTIVYDDKFSQVYKASILSSSIKNDLVSL